MPKAIAGRLKGIDHFINWEIEHLGLKPGVKVSHLLSPVFDGSLRDMFVPLVAGGEICVPSSREVAADGQRMSKSNPGTIIDPAAAAARLGADPLRLFLTKEIVFGNDGDFSWARFEEKYNVDLANNFGNLVSRVTAMAERYRGGRLVATPLGESLARAATALTHAYTTAMDELSLDVACQTAFRLVDATNEYIASS